MVCWSQGSSTDIFISFLFRPAQNADSRPRPFCCKDKAPVAEHLKPVVEALKSARARSAVRLPFPLPLRTEV